MNGGGLGQFEHFVVSKVSKIIPESIREQWNQWRQSLKNEEKSHLGSNGISETVEMAGWGVERAQERNREEASEFERNIPPPFWYPSRYGSLITSKCLKQLHVMREEKQSVSPYGIHGQLPNRVVP